MENVLPAFLIAHDSSGLHHPQICETVGPLQLFVSGSSFNSHTKHFPSAIRSTIANRAGSPNALNTIARRFVVMTAYLAK